LGVSFAEEEETQRGGFLTVDSLSSRNVLDLLMMSSHFKNHDNFYSTEHHQLVDNSFLTEIIRLREMGLLKKEDVCDKELVSCICREEQVFAENRFRFLVEWDPNALTQADINLGYTPLHHAAMRSTLQVFRMVFEYGIRYFPSKKEIILLFKKL
jgi:hypothetical protein